MEEVIGCKAEKMVKIGEAALGQNGFFPRKIEYESGHTQTPGDGRTPAPANSPQNA
ncbi:MAG: hypothetical protein ACJAVZ_003562 [Afipia broomeae]|jgi:hypothetical protein